jgi:hypothetical protein
MEMEAAAEDFYRRASLQVEASRADALRGLADRHARRRDRLERLRREELNEAILEPIAGLDARRFWVDPPSGPDPMGARQLEEAGQRFYREAAQKAHPSLGRMGRIFAGWAEENGRHIEALSGGLRG